VSEQHEIRVDGDRSWCETCDWNAVPHTIYNALDQAYLHFCDPDPYRNAKGEADPALTVCDFCPWPDRIWVHGRPSGDQGITAWPRPARWQWDIRGSDRSWVLACDEHEHLGPSGNPQVYKLLMPAS
jgi:hypothetical protein